MVWIVDNNIAQYCKCSWTGRVGALQVRSGERFSADDAVLVGIHSAHGDNAWASLQDLRRVLTTHRHHHDLVAIGDFNVIAVDWGGGSASLYSQSAANTRLVALEVAYLISFLQVHFVLLH